MRELSAQADAVMFAEDVAKSASVTITRKPVEAPSRGWAWFWYPRTLLAVLGRPVTVSAIIGLP